MNIQKARAVESPKQGKRGVIAARNEEIPLRAIGFSAPSYSHADMNLQETRIL